jgi:tetratricopeptide (TPR) repeat protein
MPFCDTADCQSALRGFAISGLTLLSVAVLFVSGCGRDAANLPADEFTRQMNVGKNYLDKGDGIKAVEAFSKAVGTNPTHPDARLNLANAFLKAGQGESAIQQAQEVLKLNPSEAAAHYVIGCAQLRLSQFEPAVQSLQTTKNFDRTVNAVSFQLGRAYQGWGHFEDAVREFEEVVQWETNHPSAYYSLSQALIRLNRTEEATKALEQHQQLLAKQPGAPTDASTYEKCIYTEARVPFQLEQPSLAGVTVTFADATQSAFGNDAKNFHGPIGVLDINHRGSNDLFVAEGNGGFRLLINSNGVFQAQGDRLPGIAGATYSRCLVGDLNNDRFEDVIVVGDKGVTAFRFATNGATADATIFAGLQNVAGQEGALADLDFTGKLGLLLIPPGTNTVRVLRNLGSMYFKDVTATSGVPASLTSARQIVVDDWNNDDAMDLFVARDGQPPLLLTKQRGGGLTETNSPADWPKGTALAVGDLNNDLRNDVVIATADTLEIFFNGLTNRASLPLGTLKLRGLTLSDYDNDGWLDLCAHGDGVRIWRNLGTAGFREATKELGLEKLAQGPVEALAAADFDGDGDTDLLLSVDKKGLQLLRNDGGNANGQFKLRLFGNRSNASGIGIRVEVTAGHWRTIRTVSTLPLEIGIGRHKRLDSVNVRWLDLAFGTADLEVEARQTLSIPELSLPTGSCPYLYAWDGQRFRFVTDILGAAPMGLPVAEGHYIEADPDEYVWIGNESTFKPRGDNYTVQITEELREVLYLDEAKLVVVDHPPGTEVYPTDKLLPGKPFPRGELATLHHGLPLLRASRSDGADATAALREADGQVVSPVRLRVPQLRGLAEPYSVTLDFGPLAVDRPLVLALTGWLRFGGGTANIAASHDPDLPFPFPQLEVETAEEKWQPVDVVAGAPAGKTKRIIIDLAGKLPPQSRRLRLTTAFEIHWDQAVLFERADSANTRIATLTPHTTDLHWRGFSEFEDLPWTYPLTPRYESARQKANWRITPAGWCTRYGNVNDLVAQQDDALVLLNGGDELTLTFPTKQLPEKPPGYVRDFFLFTVGWDKDADFHVARGTTVEPLPFRGMDDQRYGLQSRPVSNGDAWIEKYNTRWVGSLTLPRNEGQAAQVRAHRAGDSKR